MNEVAAPEKLFNKNFVLLWQGQAASQLGSAIFNIAIIFWVKHTTGSATLLGLLMMLSSTPGLLLAILAGSFADRFSRRRIIILSDVACGFLMLFLAVLWHTDVGLTGLLVWVFVINTGMSGAGSFFVPAISAALPDIVPRDCLERANSLRTATRQICFFAGRLIGATLYRLLGPPLLTLLNGGSFLLSALTETFIEIPQKLPPTARTWRGLMISLKAELLQGFSYVWQTRGLKLLILTAAFTNFFIMAIIVLLPFYVEDYLAATVEWYAILVSVFGMGIALGAGLAGCIRLRGSVRSNVLISLAILDAITAAALGFVHGAVTAGALGFGIGVGMGFSTVYCTSIIQQRTPTEVRGRVFGFITTVAESTIPLGMGFGGLAFDLLDQNIPVVFGSCGAIMAIFLTLMACNHEFRAFLSGED